MKNLLTCFIYCNISFFLNLSLSLYPGPDLILRLYKLRPGPKLRQRLKDFLVRSSCYSLSVTFFLLILLPIPALCSDPPFLLPERTELLKIRSAKMITDHGEIIFELFPEEAPWHIANLKYLADQKYFDGKIFHIYKPNYVIQAGGTHRDPAAGVPWTLAPEFSDRKHTMGILGMARRPDMLNPERRSHGSQFHIILGRSPHLDGTYTILGEILKGHEVLKKLRRGDRIQSLEVYVTKLHNSGDSK